MVISARSSTYQREAVEPWIVPESINVAQDLAPHDISIVNFIMEEFPRSVNCSGNAHITPGVEDVTSMCINYTKDRFAIVQSSWLDPRKVREMTIVGSKRMIVYDDVEQQEKIKIYDARGCAAALRYFR